MPIEATHHIRPLQGHTQPQLMLCDDNELYVVKLQNNLRRRRQLVSEYLATELARWAGLHTKACAPVNVPQFLIDRLPALGTHTRQDAGRYEAGPHLGLRYVGGLSGRPVMDILPETYLDDLTNRETFAGIFALDKWCSNANRRQAVFYRGPSSKRYTAYFIDQGDCFSGAAWAFSDLPGHGLFDRRSVYRNVTGWNSFEPFLSRLVSIRPEIIGTIVQSIPPEWYDGQEKSVEELIDALLKRRSHIHDLIAQSRDAIPGLFPDWIPRAYISTSVQPRSLFTSYSAQVLQG